MMEKHMPARAARRTIAAAHARGVVSCSGIAMAGIAFGTLCGLVFRFQAFVVIWIAGTIAAVVSLPISEPGRVLLVLLVAAVSQQIGYALGVILRAIAQTLIRRFHDGAPSRNG
jgi:hypothetical protein